MTIEQRKYKMHTDSVGKKIILCHLVDYCNVLNYEERWYIQYNVTLCIPFVGI